MNSQGGGSRCRISWSRRFRNLIPSSGSDRIVVQVFKKLATLDILNVITAIGFDEHVLMGEVYVICLDKLVALDTPPKKIVLKYDKMCVKIENGGFSDW